jgi:hypothetical protein
MMRARRDPSRRAILPERPASAQRSAAAVRIGAGPALFTRPAVVPARRSRFASARNGGLEVAAGGLEIDGRGSRDRRTGVSRCPIGGLEVPDRRSRGRRTGVSRCPIGDIVRPATAIRRAHTPRSCTTAPRSLCTAPTICPRAPPIGLATETPCVIPVPEDNAFEQREGRTCEE